METSSQSVTFRTAAEPSSPAAPAQPAKNDTSPSFRAGTQSKDVPVPPSLYHELEKAPYAVKHLDLKLYHDDDSFPDVKDQAAALDKYVLQQIKARGMKDEPGSYKEVVDAIYKQIGKSPNEDPIQALKRLTTAASAISRLESAKLEPVLSAKNLSPTEFEDIQP